MPAFSSPAVAATPSAITPFAMTKAKWPADGASIGEALLTNKESGSIVPGTAVYLYASAQAKKARANAVGTARCIGLVKSLSIPADDAGAVISDGLITLDTDEWDVVTGQTGGLTVGSMYYLSSATAGQLTATAPNTFGTYVQQIGVALSATTMKLSIGEPVAVGDPGVSIAALVNKDATALVICQPVYAFTVAGQVKSARANAAGTTQTLGLARSVTTAADGTADIQTDGIFQATTAQWDAITGGSGGLTPGSTYYLSAATAGRLVSTAPSTSTQFVQKIGVALSATVMSLAIGPAIIVP